MNVRDIMTTGVRTCRPGSSLAEAAIEMWHGDCGAIPVVDDDGRAVGIVTDRDICIAVTLKGQPPDRISVREVFSGALHACLPDDDVKAALKTMKTSKVRRLPVIDTEGHLKGIVSLNDIVLQAGAAKPAELIDALRSICEHRVPVVAAV